jgi:carboxyl-terminal processing protease
VSTGARAAISVSARRRASARGRRGRIAAFAAVAVVLAAPRCSTAQQNLSFESAGPDGAPAGWSAFRPDEAPTGVRIETDAAVAFAGTQSLKITQANAAGLARVAQRVPVAALLGSERGGPDAARRIRLRAMLRSAPGTRRPEIWLRIAGGRGALYLDSLGDGRVTAPESAALPPFVAANLDTAGGGEPLTGGETSAEWVRAQLELALPDDAEEVSFGALLRGAGSAWLDDLQVAVVDAAAEPAASSAAARYLGAALDTLEQHSINGAAIAWPKLRAAALRHARGATDFAGTHLALRYAIYELGDRHSYLLAPRAAALLERAPVSNARTGRAPVEPSGAALRGRFGYVSVPGFAGGTPQSQIEFAGRVQALIKDLDSPSTCGWILDLRRNSGGNLWPMLAGVGPLLGNGEIGASVYPDGRRVAVWYRDGQAGFGGYVQLRVNAPHPALLDAPVAVLIGPGTASSAEVLAAGFVGRPGALRFGAPTRGLSAGNRTFSLPDGAALVLTVAGTSDRFGRTYPGPLEPERPVSDGGPSASAAEDAVVDAALDWLEAQPACIGQDPRE